MLDLERIYDVYLDKLQKSEKKIIKNTKNGLVAHQLVVAIKSNGIKLLVKKLLHLILAQKDY